MIIKVDDKTNSAKMLYYQSLALLFLPCEKFGVDCDDNKMFVKAFEQEGKYFVKVSLIVGQNHAECCMDEPVRANAFSQMKNLIGRTILCAFYKIFQRKPAWGISTGVKPVKLAKTIRDYFPNENLESVLTNDYAILKQKARLTCDALSFEDKVLESMPDNP